MTDTNPPLPVISDLDVASTKKADELYLTPSASELTRQTTPQLALKQQANPHNAYLAAMLACRDDATPEMLHHLIHNFPTHDGHPRGNVAEYFWEDLAKHPNITEPLMEHLLQTTGASALGLTANPNTPARLLKQVASNPPPDIVNNWMLARALENIAQHSNATPEILIIINNTHTDLNGIVLNHTINNPNTTLEVLEALIPTLEDWNISTTTLAEALTKHPKYSAYPREWVEELIKITK